MNRTQILTRVISINKLYKVLKIKLHFKVSIFEPGFKIPITGLGIEDDFTIYSLLLYI